MELINASVARPNICQKYCCIKPNIKKVSKLQYYIRLIFCCGKCNKIRKIKIVYDTNREKIHTLLEQKKLFIDPNDKHKIDEYFKIRRLEIHRKRFKTGPFIGSLTKQIMQMS